MTTGLVDCIENAIKHRFQRIFEHNDPILAAVVLPKFKLNWVESQDEYKLMLLQVMQECADDEAIVTPESQEESQKARNKKDDFYEFKSDDKSSSQNSSIIIEVEVNEYLSNAKRIECLHKYPTIKKLFRMYNTVLSSSAPMERLFSHGVDTKAKQID